MDCKNTISMEDILIEEVRQRPSIYDKSTAVYKNNRIREQEWREVAKAVNTIDVEAVKKRWRSLRDSFIKIQRSLRHNPKQMVKWLYYKRLTFLIPHIESKEFGIDVNTKSEDDDTIQDTSHGDNELEATTDFRFVTEDTGFSDASVSSQSKTEFSKKRKKLFHDEDPLITPEQFFDRYIKKRSRNSVEDEVLEPIGKEADADEQFLLSCLPALKRLQPRENAIARIRIQQVLFDIEFGADQQNGGIIETKVEEIDDE